MGGILQQFGRHAFHGQNMVHQSRGNGAAKDRIVLGGVERLGHGHAAMLLHRGEAQGAVRAGAREHNTHGVFATVFRQRAEKAINGRPVAARLVGWLHAEHAVLNGQCGVGGNDIDMIGEHLGMVLSLMHRHAGVTPQNLGQGAGPVRSQMHHHHKRHAGIVGHVLKKGFARFQPPGGRAQSHHQEAFRRFATYRNFGFHHTLTILLTECSVNGSSRST